MVVVVEPLRVFEETFLWNCCKYSQRLHLIRVSGPFAQIHSAVPSS